MKKKKLTKINQRSSGNTDDAGKWVPYLAVKKGFESDG